MEEVVRLISNLTAIYIVFGVMAYLAFLFKGFGQIDPHTKETSFGFKLLILPGTLVFWPWLLIKWYKKYRSL